MYEERAGGREDRRENEEKERKRRKERKVWRRTEWNVK